MTGSRAGDIEAATHWAALGSADVQFVRAGTGAGWPVDVGHDDLLAGLSAPTHMFPLVADWLLEHA
jgi:hypothetical protein